MSKLLEQEKVLDALRVKRRRHAGTTSAALAQREPEPILLLTHQRSPEPVTPGALPPRLRRLWLRRPGARWVLAGVAACGVFVVVSANRRRPAVATAPPHEASTALTPSQLPTLAGTPQPPVSEAPSFQRRSEVNRRAQEMDRALADAQRVMGLMEKAMREAAQAYASTPAPSDHAGPSPTDTSS